jgi:hypothetical protein
LVNLTVYGRRISLDLIDLTVDGRRISRCISLDLVDLKSNFISLSGKLQLKLILFVDLLLHSLSQLIVSLLQLFEFVGADLRA